MKPLSRIIPLVVVVSGIIAFWLAPGINTARDTTYTRKYEDMDKILPSVSPDTLPRKISAKQKEVEAPLQSKAYKKERLASTTKLSKIKASQFSRAVQFVEEEVEVDLDSIEVEQKIVAIDTANQIQ